ncbi:pentapeptide repeat-containing protein [Coleofasciculus sp. E1-EBD-02]|uniref:pentapeptide repeat-containing protein n=1 Tax=Coleofasciculus sp. E1-EBD-02 TaxID=3068481 RepID=UPI0032FF1E9F
MKADEVLRRYAAGERDFRRVNLRGQSFKGKDLKGADFSEADIRGANFTNAYLKDAKFCGAKAGLQRRWQISLTVIALLVSVFSGFLCWFPIFFVLILFSGGLLNVLIGWVSLSLIIVFLIVIIHKGINSVAVTVAVTVAGAVAVAGAVTGAATGAVAIAVTGAFTGFVAVAVAGAFTGAVAVAVAGAVAGAVTGAVAFAFAFAGAVAFTGNFIRISAVALAFAATFVLLCAYISWQALAGDEKYAIIHTNAIAFSTKGGTSFRHANLTNVGFTSATLKSTDFRRAILTRTCWRNTKKLNRIRPGNTYLQNANLRQLLITGQGQDQNFDYQNLRGVNLQGANLADSSFIGADLNEANLQDVDLSRAKLVQTQLDEADLTGATLTGATIEDWNITSHTQLQGIRCRYVFMRLPTKDDPEPRRKPDNREEEFEDGDFADFIKPIVDTLDLYHNQGVDPRAIAISLKQLAENNPEAELEIVAMEKRGKDKLLLRAATAPDADHSKLNAEYFKTYNQIKALAEAEVQALLAEKDSRISSLETMVETALQRPSFYTNTQVEQVDIMTNNPGGISQSNTGSMGGGQQGAIGDQNKQTMSTQAAASAGEQLTQQDVLQMLGQIEQMIDSAEIPEEIKEEANTYLGAAKKAVEKEEPNKERVNINLEGVAEQLDKASKVAEAGTTLFTKVKPILVKVAGWLGAAAGSFFGTL